ncbi:MAG: DNA recombination protein RmuC, partial [Proteobacteria bacterium]|nr:DNA recombination protein RmuC [Pseudomonadota bacterium]
GELQQRFHKAEESIREIRISTDKITGRGDKIVDAELGDETPAEDLPPPQERIERSG